MQYTAEILQLIEKYASLREELSSLEKRTEILNLEKNRLELELVTTREQERSLIDRIKSETGTEPNFYKILQQVQNGRVELIE